MYVTLCTPFKPHHTRNIIFYFKNLLINLKKEIFHRTSIKRSTKTILATSVLVLNGNGTNLRPTRTAVRFPTSRNWRPVRSSPSRHREKRPNPRQPVSRGCRPQRPPNPHLSLTSPILPASQMSKTKETPARREWACGEVPVIVPVTPPVPTRPATNSNRL